MQPQQYDQQPNNNNNNTPRPGTPPRPPYSPVTPVFAHLQPTANNHSIVPPPAPSSISTVSLSPTSTHPHLPPSHPHTHTQTHTRNETSSSMTAPPAPAPVFATEPPPLVPISESENPDAIALRSAISVLQIQKQQSLRDIQALDRMKRAVAADPERFAQELAAGNLSEGDRGGFVNLSEHRQDGDEDENEDGNADEGPESRGDAFSNLGKIPTAQNVVRMPPINWAKYQVVGESLDKMHSEQLRRPSAGEPRREESTQRAPEHILASPYRPLVDKLESPGKKGANRNKKS